MVWPRPLRPAGRRPERLLQSSTRSRARIRGPPPSPANRRTWIRNRCLSPGTAWQSRRPALRLPGPVPIPVQTQSMAMLHFNYSFSRVTIQVMENFRQFEAGSDPFGGVWAVQFKWLQTAISLRHSDTVDVRFVLRSGEKRLEKTIAMP